MPKKASIRRIVLDILKPLDPSLIEVARAIVSAKGVEAVNLVVYEMDRKTETVKATIEGKNIDFESVKKVVEKFGAVIHSIDQVVVGKKIVEETKTPQDRLLQVP